MSISNAKLASTLKRVAQTVAPIVKKKTTLKTKMDELEAKYREKLEAQLAKYKTEYEELTAQQELFEKPIREVTGGYGTEDLIDTVLVEHGTDKDGKPIRKTQFLLKYPDTILPTGGVDTTAEEDEDTYPTDSEEDNIGTVASVAAETLVQDEDDLPFSI